MPLHKVVTSVLIILALAAAIIAPSPSSAEALSSGKDPRPGLSTEGAWSWQDYPYWVPHSEPLTVVAVEGFLAENFQGPVSFEFDTPEGEFSRIILRVDIELVSVVEGRPAVQYDRPLWIWINSVPAFVGTTTQRYNYVAFSDVTHLYPLLVGGRKATLTIALPNWVIPDLGLTGAFRVNVTLLYYPGPKPSWTPDLVIPLFTGSERTPWPGLAVLRLTSSDNVASDSIKLPVKAARAFLLLYSEGASYDEFWYASIPAPRLFVFKAGDNPFVIAPPLPMMYTGSLNPLLWRPIPGVRTLSFEPILIDVTPAIPLLLEYGSIEVEAIGINDYWMIFPALLVYLDEGIVGHELVYVKPMIPSVKAEGLQGDTRGNYRFLYNASLEIESKTYVVKGGMVLEAHSRSYMEASIEGSQNFTEDTMLLNLYVSASYTSTASNLLPGPSSWWRSLYMQTTIDYKFVVEPQGDPSQATPDNPVPALFTLYTKVSQSLEVDGIWPFTATYRASSEASDAEAKIAGELIFIGPTAAIITGITEAWGLNAKDVWGSESPVSREGEVGPAIIQFYRKTVGSNEWPEWSVESDDILVVWL
ncbi:MAG: hypothetical protein F7B17_09330 [Desulfurococcales archaeon]|nr:hypothetical protein [Desulfurococcales archaeon]